MVEIVFNDGGTLVPVVVVAAPEEVHRFSAIATDQEVERGVDVTDHVRAEARPMQLTVTISDTPLGPNAAVTGSIESRELELPPRAFQAPVGPLIQVAASPQSALLFAPDEMPVTRVVDTWRTLVDASARGLLATITTPLETHEDMVLLSGEVTRTVKDGSAITALLVFRKIQQVATEVVDVPEPVRPRDRARVERGSQATAPADEGQRSIWLRLFGSSR